MRSPAVATLRQLDTVRVALVFDKHYSKLVEAERAKALELERVARRNGFIAPSVLEVDPDRQVITYEWIHGLRSLRSAYLDYTGSRHSRGTPELFARVGRTLAQIHRDLRLGDSVPWDPPAVFQTLLDRRLGQGSLARLDQTPQAFLHGDFGFGNVHLEEATDRLVVLDPSPNGYLTVHPSTWGSIYLDVGFLVSCLRGLVGPARFIFLRRNRIGRLESAFVSGYQDVSGSGLDPVLLEAVAYATAGTYLRSRYSLPFLGEMALRVMFPETR